MAFICYSHVITVFFSFNLYICLYLKSISYSIAAHSWVLFLYSVCQCLLPGMFSPHSLLQLQIRLDLGLPFFLLSSICISLNTDSIGHLFMDLLVIHTFSLFYPRLLPIFSFVILLLIFKISLYKLYT